MLVGSDQAIMQWKIPDLTWLRKAIRRPDPPPFVSAIGTLEQARRLAWRLGPAAPARRRPACQGYAFPSAATIALAGLTGASSAPDRPRRFSTCQAGVVMPGTHHGGLLNRADTTSVTLQITDTS